MIEQQARGLLDQPRRIRTVFGQRPREAERLPHRPRGLAACHRPTRNRIEQPGELIHQLMADRAEGLGVHRERRVAGCAVSRYLTLARRRRSVAWNHRSAPFAVKPHRGCRSRRRPAEVGHARSRTARGPRPEARGAGAGAGSGGRSEGVIVRLPATRRSMSPSARHPPSAAFCIVHFASCIVNVHRSPR